MNNKLETLRQQTAAIAQQAEQSCAKLQSEKAVGSNKPVVKRWYKNVETVNAEGGWAVMLDGKRLRSPAGNPLELPNQAVAGYVAAEWDAIAENAPIHVGAMPGYSLCCIAGDIISQHAGLVRAELLDYLDTEMLCYRALEPDALVLKQAEQWNPVLEWAKERYGIDLPVTAGIMPVAIQAKDREQMQQELEKIDGLRLAALSVMVKSLGSLVLALAVLETHLMPESAGDISLVDQHFQQKKWGRELEHDQAENRIKREITTAAQIIATLT